MMGKSFSLAIIGAIFMMASARPENSEDKATSNSDACCDKNVCSEYQSNCKKPWYQDRMKRFCESTCNFCTGPCPDQCSVWWNALNDTICSDICEKRSSIWKDSNFMTCYKKYQKDNQNYLNQCERDYCSCCDKSVKCPADQKYCLRPSWRSRYMKKNCKTTCGSFCTQPCDDQCSTWWKESKKIICSDICEKEESFWSDSKFDTCLKEYEADNQKMNELLQCKKKCACCDKSLKCSADQKYCNRYRYPVWRNHMENNCKNTCGFCTQPCPDQCSTWWDESKEKICSDICEKKESFWSDIKFDTCLKEYEADNQKMNELLQCKKKCECSTWWNESKKKIFSELCENEESSLLSDSKFETCLKEDNQKMNELLQYKQKCQRRDFVPHADREYPVYGEIEDVYDYPKRRDSVSQTDLEDPVYGEFEEFYDYPFLKRRIPDF